MTRHDAQLKVGGPNAQNVANSILSAMGVDPRDVVEIEAEVTTVNDGETITSLTSDGLGAGHIARAMLNGVDWDEHRPVEVEVSLVTQHSDADDADEPEPESEPEPEPSAPDELAYRGDENEDDTNPEFTEENLPDELTPNTPPHLALTAVAAYYTKIVSSGGGKGDGTGDSEEDYESGVRGVSARQLARSLDIPVDYNTFAQALAEAASDHAVLDQNVADRNDGATDAYYQVNDIGRAFLNANGPHADLEEMDISLAIEDEGPTHEGRELSYEELLTIREAATGTTKTRTNSGTRELYIEEPRVDEPQSVSRDTRYHEVLWTLAQWHAENGGETWAPITELYEFTPFDFPSQGAFGAPTSEVFLDHALIERRQVGRRAECRLNEAGWDEVERLGPPEAARGANGATTSTDEVALNES